MSAPSIAAAPSVEAARVAALVDHALDLIGLVDATGRFHFINAAVERILGYAPADLIGRSAFGFMHPADMPRVMAMFLKGIATSGYSAEATYRFRHADGTWRVLESRAKNLLHDPDVGGVVFSSRDVTERVAVEERLSRSETQTRALLDAIPDAMVRLNREGRYLDFHAPAGYEALVSHERFVGRTVHDVLPPELAQRAMQAIRATLETGRMQHFDYTADVGGECRWREARVMVCGPDEVISVQRDITDRKHAEAALRASEANFRALFERSPDAIVVHTPDGRILNANPAAAALHGIPCDRLVGSNLLDVVPERLHQHVLDGLDALLQERRQYLEGHVLNASGAEVPVEIRARRVEVANRAGILLHVRDTSARKRAEAALHESQARLRTVVGNVPIVLFAVDRDGTFKLSEGRGLHALGARRGDAVGQSAFALYADVPPFLDGIRRALGGEETAATITFRGLTFECRFVPYVGADGTVGGVTGVAADVTALKTSQEGLRRLAAHLQGVREEERTRISREVHDVLGQALTAMRMETAAIEKRVPERDDALRAHLDALKHLIDTTVHTTRRIAADLRPGILDDLGIGAALEWETMQFQARTGITCTLEDTADLFDLDRGRSTALFRIFQEIMTNVARHADATAVQIQIEELTGESGRQLRLRVRDDGRGIRDRDLAGITSLGLLGMRERVRPWNGHLHFDGTPGAGTTVTVVLPLDSPPATPDPT